MSKDDSQLNIGNAKPENPLETVSQVSLQIQREKISFAKTICIFISSLQFLSMLLLTAQQTGMPFLVRSAHKNSSFIPSTSVFMMEIMKIIVCTALIFYNCNYSMKESLFKLYKSIWLNKLETLKVSVPAFIYAVQNNLFYIALANIDATTYSVTYQLRILTTAILAVAILGKMLSEKQWIALVISFIGVIMVQLDKASPVDLNDGNKALGILSTFTMCWTSAFAGVYFEKMLKNPSSDMWIQNLRLSLMTLTFATLTMIAKDGNKIYEGGLFHGWTMLVWIITIINSIGGLAVSLVMKYADNVKKTYCQTIAIGLTAIISIFIGERVLSPILLIGVSFVISSVYIYTFYPPIKTYTLLKECNDSSLTIEEVLIISIKKFNLIPYQSYMRSHYYGMYYNSFFTLFFLIFYLIVTVVVAANTTTTGNLSGKVTSKLENKASKKYNEFQEWLKWDVECNFLTTSEREIRVSQGRCPPLTTTTSAPIIQTNDLFSFFKRAKPPKKKKISGSIFNRGSKRKLLTLITMGQQSIDNIQITENHGDYNLIAGTLLEVTCGLDSLNETADIVWYVNTNKIELGLLDWRVTVDNKNKLSIWPLTVEDSGFYECSKNGILEASAHISVRSKMDAFIEGLINYFVVSIIYLPIASILLLITNRSSLDPPQSSLKEDRMALFLEEHIMKNGADARENIARVVYGQTLKKRKVEIEKSIMQGLSAQGGSVFRGNQHTIMTILQPTMAPKEK